MTLLLSFAPAALADAPSGPKCKCALEDPAERGAALSLVLAGVAAAALITRAQKRRQREEP